MCYQPPPRHVEIEKQKSHQYYFESMDPFTTIVTATQAAGYVISPLRALHDVHLLVRKGDKIIQHHRSNISDLICIISTFNSNRLNYPSTPFKHILTALETTSHRLLDLFQEASKFKITITLLVRREEIDQNFTSLERYKSTLILYLATQTSLTVDAMMKNCLRKKRGNDRSQETRTSLEVSDHR